MARRLLGLRRAAQKNHVVPVHQLFVRHDTQDFRYSVTGLTHNAAGVGCRIIN